MMTTVPEGTVLWVRPVLRLAPTDKVADIAADTFLPPTG